MIKHDELEIGLLVWWSADRTANEWSCPCVVTKVNRENNTFQVMSFDDFRTSELIIERKGPDKSVLDDEMRMCDLQEVRDYFRERRSKLESRKTTLEKEIAGIDQQLVSYSKEPEEVAQYILSDKRKSNFLKIPTI